MGGVRIDGDIRKLYKRLSKIENLDMRGVNLALAEAIRKSTRGRFKNQEGPDGDKWKPSQRVTSGVKREKTLTDTGRLRRSINSKADKKGFSVGTNVKYAATHQFGDEDRELGPITIRAKNKKSLKFNIGGKDIFVKKVYIPSLKVTIPARPFLGINEADINEIKSTLLDLVGEDE
jgi:phage virion morphogenesis protein